MLKSTPVHDSDGFLRMAINVIEDITAHKRGAGRALHVGEQPAAGLVADLDEVLEQVA